jgi:hypothetical protein
VIVLEVSLDEDHSRRVGKLEILPQMLAGGRTIGAQVGTNTGGLSEGQVEKTNGTGNGTKIVAVKESASVKDVEIEMHLLVELVLEARILIVLPVLPTGKRMHLDGNGFGILVRTMLVYFTHAEFQR